MTTDFGDLGLVSLIGLAISLAIGFVCGRLSHPACGTIAEATVIIMDNGKVRALVAGKPASGELRMDLLDKAAEAIDQARWRNQE